MHPIYVKDKQRRSHKNFLRSTVVNGIISYVLIVLSIFVLIATTLALHEWKGYWPNGFRQIHWPRTVSWVHGSFIVALPILWLTGIGLFWKPLHAPLIAFLGDLYWLHIGLGLTLSGAAIAIAWVLMRGSLRLRRMDWIITGSLLTAVTVSGLILWISAFPADWRGKAFTWHGYLSYALLAWLLFHGLLRAVSYRRITSLINLRFLPSRRRFVEGLSGATLVASLPYLWPTSTSTPNRRTGQNSTIPHFPEYYTYTGDIPHINPIDYHLEVGGLVAHPLRIDLPTLKQLSTKTEIENFHCVTGWEVPNIPWTGLRIDTLMRHCKPQPQAQYVVFHSADGVYVESLTLQQARAPGVLLATQIAGQPLLPKGGYPLRLVVPNMYGYKSIKWVNRIEFTDTRPEGTWEKYGYAANAYIRNTFF